MWRSKPAEEAFETFKKFLSCIMIRQTKKILELPGREDRIMRLTFDDQENEHYRRIERPVVDMLDKTARESNNSGTSWMTTLQQINKLRLVCVLGTSVPLRQSCITQSGDDEQLAVLATRFSMGGELCMQCLQAVESPSSGTLLAGSSSPSVYYSSCNLFFCAECSGLLRFKAPEPCGCTGGWPSCPLRPLAPFVPSPKLTPSEDSPLSPTDMGSAFKISSKVQALISQIKSYPSEKQ